MNASGLLSFACLDWATLEPAGVAMNAAAGNAGCIEDGHEEHPDHVCCHA